MFKGVWNKILDKIGLYGFMRFIIFLVANIVENYFLRCYGNIYSSLSVNLMDIVFNGFILV